MEHDQEGMLAKHSPSVSSMESNFGKNASSLRATTSLCYPDSCALSSGCGVVVPSEVVVLNSIVLPHKQITQKLKNEIIL